MLKQVNKLIYFCESLNGVDFCHDIVTTASFVLGKIAPFQEVQVAASINAEDEASFLAM